MKRSAKLPLPSKQYERDSRWVDRHYKALSLKYPNKWVAVHKGRVVAVADDLGSAKRLAQQRTGTSDVLVQPLYDGTTIF